MKLKKLMRFGVLQQTSKTAFLVKEESTRYSHIKKEIQTKSKLLVILHGLETKK